MNAYKPATRKNIIDKVGESAVPQIDDTPLSARPIWWWIVFMPGKVILWLEYMFPRRIGGVFGSARRRNVPLAQIAYSLCFYAALIAVGFALFR